MNPYDFSYTFFNYLVGYHNSHHPHNGGDNNDDLVSSIKNGSSRDFVV